MIKFLITFLLLFKRVELSDISFYEILGVTKQASTQEIRHAYKKLAVKFHPDKNADLQDQSKFIKITEAYEILKDPIKRQNYDLYGSQLSYTRKYDYHSETEYNNLYYNGLYNNDPFVESVSEKTFYSYLNDGFHFINFYSPFCPPCQNLVDHWKKLAQKYNGIVKVGAVNCKYHNSFCFNTMRIGSYPTLLFYPNGKDGNYLKYGGDRTLDSFDQFIMSYLKNQVHIATVSQIQSTNKPIAYVLGTKRIDKNALIRIAYHLKNLLSVLIVKDDTLRETLSKNEYATVVFKYKDVSKHIESTEEDVVLAEIVNSLPEIDLIGPDKLKDIRNQLRRGSNIPWVLYFTNANSDRLILHQMKMEFPDIHFGEVDCERWGEVCASLQVSVGAGGAWGVLKAGGAFERAPPAAIPRRFLPAALAATNLHSLSASDFNNILSGDAGKWVLLVVPHQVSLSHISELFTQTSLHFITSLDISFGIMACTQNNNNNCRSFAHNQPAVVLQDGRERHFYSGRIEIKNLKEFIKLLLDSKDVQLDEQDMLDIMEPSTRQYSWLVAYFPSGCGRKCDDLAHQWRLVADKLTALEDVRVGLLRCSADGALCSNVRVPAARLYPAYTPHHHTVSLEQMLLAPYILEWALGHIDGSVVQLDWNTFSKLVIAEELNPSSDKKPWLVYFHSPRCYRCYELYPDFVLTGMFLKNAVNLGKVNCLSERGVCQHERITAYPSLKLYRPRLATINLHPTDHEQLVHDIQPHLAEYKQYSINLDNLEVHTRAFNVKHDEF